MVEVNVITIPDKKEDESISYKFKKIVEDRNQAISKKFKMDALDVDLKLYYSAGALRNVLDPNGDHMGVFSGYKEGENSIHLVHPDSVIGLFDDIDKELNMLIDMNLIRMYLCKKYYPERSDFRMFHKYIADFFSEIACGKGKMDYFKFDLKVYNENIKPKKEQEVRMSLYLMYEKSGVDFIYENLDIIMEDQDFNKSLFKIYKRSFSDLMSFRKKEIEEKEKQYKVRKNR